MKGVCPQAVLPLAGGQPGSGRGGFCSGDTRGGCELYRHAGGVAVPPGSGDWSVGVVLISTILCVGLSFSVILTMVEVAAPLVGTLGFRVLMGVSDGPAQSPFSGSFHDSYCKHRIP